MASYHFSVQMIGRADGRSAVAAAAYRSGTRLVDPLSGVVHDYRRKGDVISSVILAPAGAPSWAVDRQGLWSKVEIKEARKNSQLAREVVVALPHDLSSADAVELLLGWVEEAFVSLGMVADISIHDPRSTEHAHKPSNLHAHILLTTREIDTSSLDGWSSNKNRSWNDKSLLDAWRQTWADRQNEAFQRQGLDVRVDHRSLSSQLLSAVAAGDPDAYRFDRCPEPRLGVAASAMLRRGVPVRLAEAVRLSRVQRQRST